MVYIFRAEYGSNKKFIIRIEDKSELNAWFRVIKHLKNKKRNELNRVDLIVINAGKIGGEYRVFKTNEKGEWLIRCSDY